MNQSLFDTRQSGVSQGRQTTITVYMVHIHGDVTRDVTRSISWRYMI